jgi:hypothetical protein
VHPGKISAFVNSNCDLVVVFVLVTKNPDKAIQKQKITRASGKNLTKQSKKKTYPCIPEKFPR